MFAFNIEKGEGVAFAFIVEKGEGVRLPLSQKKERCRVAFYAKKRSRRVVSWMFFPKRRIPKKLLKTLEAGMRKLSHPQLNPLSCRVRMFFPKRRMSKSFL